MAGHGAVVPGLLLRHLGDWRIAEEGGLAEFECDLIRARTGEGRAPPEEGSVGTASAWRFIGRDRAELQRQSQHDFGVGV
jgi:hypothetical protein